MLPDIHLWSAMLIRIGIADDIVASSTQQEVDLPELDAMTAISMATLAMTYSRTATRNHVLCYPH